MWNSGIGWCTTSSAHGPKGEDKQAEELRGVEVERG
jgi:hypothetical protein